MKIDSVTQATGNSLFIQGIVGKDNQGREARTDVVVTPLVTKRFRWAKIDNHWRVVKVHTVNPPWARKYRSKAERWLKDNGNKRKTRPVGNDLQV